MGAISLVFSRLPRSRSCGDAGSSTAPALAVGALLGSERFTFTPGGMAVPTKVHKNLNRGCWSVARAGERVEHVEATALANVRFVVQPGGLARVRRTGVRAVHAYATGDETTATDVAGLTEVTYNTFTTRDGKTVTRAALVVFAADGRAYAGGLS